jgi:hypothetical protein
MQNAPFKYRTKKLFNLLAVFLLTSALQSLAATDDWRELSGEHFKVYFNGDQNFAKEVLEKSEVYYQRIATDLGYPRYSEFWTWDKRVKIYIYPDHPSFLKATGQPDWSQGVAEYTNKEIRSFAWSSGFTESLLPHEIAHLIFRDFVGFQGQVPLWLDEGVAQWEEEPKRKAIKAMARQYFDNDSLLSLDDMMKLDIRKVTLNDKVYIRITRTKTGEKGTLLLSGNNLISTYYLQAVSLVGFLIEKYGSYSFADFCRQLRDGKSLEEALKFAYPTHIRNLDDLENNWREYVEKEE